jgi:hypothetical protein
MTDAVLQQDQKKSQELQILKPSVYRAFESVITSEHEFLNKLDSTLVAQLMLFSNAPCSWRHFQAIERVVKRMTPDPATNEREHCLKELND